MTQATGEQRSETARRNDDRDIIEAADEEALSGQVHAGSSGGNLQRDVATQVEHERVADPEAREGVTKGDQIAHGQHSDEPRTGNHVAADRDRR